MNSGRLWTLLTSANDGIDPAVSPLGVCSLWSLIRQGLGVIEAGGEVAEHADRQRRQIGTGRIEVGQDRIA